MKTVIITGASGHLGKAVTQTFLDHGYRVIATVHNETAKSDFGQHERLQVETVNLANEEETTAALQRMIKAAGRIDAALLLVGGFALGTIADTGSADIRQQITLNFDTAYHVARPLLAHFHEQNAGRLVFIGSRPALQPADGKNMVAYSLSKSLLFRLAELINAEAKGKNITATVVVPSTLDTPPNRQSMPKADPGRWVRPQDLAAIIEFICSDAADPVREAVVKVYNNA